ncbi:hypothetical protein AB0I28_23765 [Phytomonospora sp. NPDC050363]|uniref:hypothetical protein n=1 Tax=Phytomonospora sp. NPDC050363 TaxID=3155642 RepID=UPI0033F9FE9E
MSFGAEVKDAVTVRAVLLVVGVLVLQVLFIASYVGALHAPKPSRVPFGLFAAGSGELAATLDALPGDPLDVRVGDSEEGVRADIMHRRTYGALIVDSSGDEDTLLVATGSGTALAAALERIVGGVAEQEGRRLVVEDVAPAPQDKDFDGLSSFYLAVGWCVGGYLCASILAISAGSKPANRRRAVIRTGAMAAYSIAGGLLGTLVVGPLLGALPGSFMSFWGLGALTVFAVGMITLALEALTGVVGIGLAVLLIVIAGNPSAGGAFPLPMLPPLWRAIGPFLPPGAGTWTSRSIAYFDGNAVTMSLLVLVAWSVVGTVVFMLAVPRRATAAEGA